MGRGCIAHSPNPYVFDEFFSSGLEEGSSPFLEKSSRHWGDQLSLKFSILSAILLFLAFVLSYMPGQEASSSLLLLLVYFFAGIPALIESIEDLFSFEVNIDVLMTLAAFSSVLIGSPMEGALLLVLFAISGAMEEGVTSQAMGALKELHNITPTCATVLDEEGSYHKCALQEIKPGMRILVRAGEIIPLDGKVIDGASDVNLSHMTGENKPVAIRSGDSVPAGGRTLEGALIIEITRTSSDSTLARIIKLVTQAQEAKPRLQRWFDKLSQPYATTIISLSAFFSLSLPWLLNIPVFGPEGSIYRSLAFLIAASPCALIIATPIAYLSAIGSCAKKGILLKGGIILDALTQCSTIAFDKTGTLTTGKLHCVAIEGLKEPSETSQAEIQEAVSCAYALERNAVHPIATAIESYAQSAEVKAAAIQDFLSEPGRGLRGLTSTTKEEWTPTYIGHTEYICSQVSEELAQAIQERAVAIRESGDVFTVLLVGEKAYFFRFTDTLRPGMAEALRSLESQGKHRILMLTGDHKASAKRVASALGIRHVFSELKPENKLDHVTRLADSEGLAMVGDGINDAPALARATVGISLGSIGSATAVEASDVVLLHDNVQLLGWLMRKARATRSIIKQNLALAGLAILAATTPALLGYVPLWAAVLIHEGGTVLVGLNGLRLYSSHE